MIIDICTEFLMDRGVDVGIEEIGKGTKGGQRKHSICNDNNISSSGCTVYLKDGAETPLGVIPASYRYENADGDKVMLDNISAFGFTG